MLTKVISGGQTGTDIAGLRAAKYMGLKTGGHIPRGFRTLDGPRPGYAAWYGLVETASIGYRIRTGLNVSDSDGTIRFAEDFNSQGELCTWAAIVKYRKPWFDVPLCRVSDDSDDGNGGGNANSGGSDDGPLPLVHGHYSTPMRAAQWVIDKKIAILNVAGNSEQTAPGIHLAVYGYLTKMFKILLAVGAR